MYRKIALLITIFTLLSSIAFANDRKPKEGSEGIYYLDYHSYQKLVYIVDTICEQCYAGSLYRKFGGGLVSISCEKLAKRPEWKPVIKWIKKNSTKTKEFKKN
ncbi:MAG: hypothetical protein GY714_11620 [Desulfobacterales bacterium]|nr:hypothetical protein [Desulfobacterales bacterium]